jgi:hypothetical protein
MLYEPDSPTSKFSFRTSNKIHNANNIHSNLGGDASSDIPSDSTLVQSMQKAITTDLQNKQKAITTDRDQANSSKGIHSMEATIPVVHVGKRGSYNQ